LYLEQSHRTMIVRIDPLSRKSLPLVVALVLSLGAFILCAGEAQAQQQPPAVQQFPGKASGEYSGAMDKEGAKPMAKAPSDVRHPVKTPLPASSKDSTPESAPKLTMPVNMNLAAEKPRSALLEKLTLPVQPAPDPVGFEPILSASKPLPEPMPKPVPLEEVSETLPLQAEEGSAAKEPEETLRPTPLPENVPANSATSIGASYQGARHKAAALGGIIPISLDRASLSTTSIERIEPNMLRNAGQTVLQTPPTGVATAVLGTLTKGSSEPSSIDAQKPSEDTPQPAPPFAPQVGGSSLFSPSSGGQAGSGGFAPLLIGVLASSLVLLRRGGWRYLALYELPKPTSVLLLPLEQPG
jgi:hypothetical protein